MGAAAAVAAVALLLGGGARAGGAGRDGGAGGGWAPAELGGGLSHLRGRVLAEDDVEGSFEPSAEAPPPPAPPSGAAADFPDLLGYDWVPADMPRSQTGFELPLLNETAPWLAGAIETFLAVRQGVWPILYDQNTIDNAGDVYDGEDGVTVGGQLWASLLSASLVNLSFWPTNGDGFPSFGIRAPYLTMGGGGQSWNFLDGNVVTARPLFLTWVGALAGPVLGGSANFSPLRLRLFPAFGWSELGVEAPEWRPPLVPLGWLGTSPVQLNVLGGTFLGAVEGLLGAALASVA